MANNDDSYLTEFEDISISSPSKSRNASPPPAISMQATDYSPGNAPAWLNRTADPSVPIEPIPVDGTFDFSLEINKYGYALRGHTSIYCRKIPQQASQSP